VGIKGGAEEYLCSFPGESAFAAVITTTIIITFFREEK
jgi:hypothetical protein